MKNKKWSLVARLVIIAYIITVAVFAASLVKETIAGRKLAQERFNRLTRDTTQNLLLNDVHSEAFINSFLNSLDNISDIAEIQIKDTNNLILSYPADIANGKSLVSSLVSSFSTILNTKEGKPVTLTAAIYRLKPASIYYKGRLAFLAILAAVLLCLLYIIYVSIYEPNEKNIENSDDEIDENDKLNTEDKESLGLNDEDSLSENSFETAPAEETIPVSPVTEKKDVSVIQPIDTVPTAPATATQKTTVTEEEPKTKNTKTFTVAEPVSDENRTIGNFELTQEEYTALMTKSSDETEISDKPTHQDFDSDEDDLDVQDEDDSVDEETSISEEESIDNEESSGEPEDQEESAPVEAVEVAASAEALTDKVQQTPVVMTEKIASEQKNVEAPVEPAEEPQTPITEQEKTEAEQKKDEVPSEPVETLQTPVATTDEIVEEQKNAELTTEFTETPVSQEKESDEKWEPKEIPVVNMAEEISDEEPDLDLDFDDGIFDDDTDENSNNDEFGSFEIEEDEKPVIEDVKVETENETQETEPVIIEDNNSKSEPEITSTNTIPATPSGLYSEKTGFGWESYMLPRLDNELNRSASNSQDLSLLTLKVQDIDWQNKEGKAVSKTIKEMITFDDLIFEKDADACTAVMPNTSVEDAIALADNLYSAITEITNNRIGIGVSARSLRMISGERLATESEEALKHAMDDENSPIVAFKVNPQKYRDFLAAQAAEEEHNEAD